MILRKWEDLPANMRLNEVRPYYDSLKRKQLSIVLVRVFDFFAALILLVVLCPVLAAISLAIKLDSPGPVFYRQKRITQYGREFRIHKFRSMCDGADKKGSLVTVGNDSRITKVGRVIRKYRLDETAQLFDVLKGNMSFVGTRPEVPKYVEKYTPEMMATLLLPAGITSEASIRYKDEDRLLDSAADVDQVYVEYVLPAKMEWNLKSISEYSISKYFSVMLHTVVAVLGVNRSKRKSK